MATGSGMAGLYGGIGPTAYVNRLYAPAQAQLAQQQKARTDTLTSLVNSILSNLSAPRPDVYGAAAADQTAAANAAANRLAASNPNASTQSMLQAIGAPQAQQDQVANQNRVVFGGQGALAQYAGGALPAGVFAQDQSARQSYLDALPAIVGLAGAQGVGRLGLLASQENSKLASDKASSLQGAFGDLANYVQKNQALRAKQSAAAAKTLAPNSALSRTLGYLVDSNGDPVLRGGRLAVIPGFTIGANGMVTKVSSGGSGPGRGGRSKYTISSSLSKQTGFWTDSHGNIVIGANGKPVAWKNTVKTAAAPSVAQVARWNGALQTGYSSMPAGTGYVDFLQESVKQKVPLGAAIAFANRHWPLTQRATPEQIAGIAGATPQDVNASGAPQNVADFQQMTGSTAPQSYAISRLPQYGWNNAEQAQALDSLWTRESGWNPNAVNKSSGAYGIPQSLGHGKPFKLGDYKGQIDWGLNYIRGRYGSPAAAWAHEQKFGWY